MSAIIDNLNFYFQNKQTNEQNLQAVMDLDKKFESMRNKSLCTDTKQVNIFSIKYLSISANFF